MLNLTTFFYKQSFKTGALSVFLNPLLLIRKGLIKKIEEYAPLLNGKLLDFGCGNKPYSHLFKANEYIGVDIENTTGHDTRFQKPDVYYDGITIPFNDSHFDTIFCSEVLEHVPNIDLILDELNRVLKPGGKMLITVPFCWNEHEIPFDFRRFSSFGLKTIFENRGYEILNYHKTGNFIEVIFQLRILYLYETVKRLGFLGFALIFPFVSLLNICGIIFGMLLPKNYSLYFNNVIVVKKKG